jgi:hypothetical protein
MVRVSVQKEDVASLASLLAITVFCKATNPRDCVFALLAISKNGRQLLSQPSLFRSGYNDEVEDVFLKTTAFLLSSDEDWFCLLMRAGIGYELLSYTGRSSLQDKLPSWVPDYSNAPSGPRTVATTSKKSRDPAGKATITNNLRVIHLQVLPFTAIRHLIPRFKSHEITPYNTYAPQSVRTAQVTQLLTTSLSDDRRWYLAARQLSREQSSSGRISEEAADQAFWELCISETE